MWRAFPDHGALVFQLFVLLLHLYSTFAVFRVIASANTKCDPFASRSLIIFWSFLSTLLMLRYVADGYGQREHTFMLLYMPFFLLRWARYQGQHFSRTLAVTIGLFAALGVCLKPHFVVIAAVCELYAVINQRSLRRLVNFETVAFTIGGLAYVD